MTEIAKTQGAPVAEHDAQIATFRPPVDIFENADAYVVEADMPGILPDDVVVNLERDTLLIEGKSQTEGLEPLLYQRTFRVMRGLDPTAVTAGYQNGVLTVRLPKPESHKPRSITVTAG